jgi:transposase
LFKDRTEPSYRSGGSGLRGEPRSTPPLSRPDAVVSADAYETPAPDETQSSAPSARLHSAQEQACPHSTYVCKLASQTTKVRDVVGLYLAPPERAVVLCVDEKSQIQALDRTAPILPMLPGNPAARAHDYKRSGTSSLYAALDISSGQVIGTLHARHRAIEFKKFLQTIDREVPADLAVHLVLDNSSTHKTPAIQRWLAAHPRFVMHFTPTSSSWLNLVERWFAELTTKKLRRGAHRSVGQLNADIRAWIETWNENPQPFVWTKTADQILDSISRYCNRINDSRH